MASRRYGGLVGLLAAIMACDGVSRIPSAPGPAGPLIGVDPGIAAVTLGSQTTFDAEDHQMRSVSVTWLVDGIPGGNATVGTIGSNGVYVAPATIPDADSVVITAASTEDTTRRSATVFFVPGGGAADYVTLSPRVVDATAAGAVRLFVVPPTAVASVIFVPKDGSTPQVLTRIGSGTHLLRLTHAQAVAGHVTASLHNRLGSLDYRDASGGVVKLTGVGVSVRDGGMPAVTITTLAPDAQRTDHVLNLRADAPSLESFSPAVVMRALQLLGDRFEQLTLAANVSSNNNRYHALVRNAVQGIALPIVDGGAQYGSAGRLQGVNYFPLDAFFDAGETAMSHELGHQWINYSGTTTFSPGRPHWPPSDVANGVMGFSIGGTGGQGGTFPYTLTSVGGNQYRVDPGTASRLFGPWDLYLMGLLSPDSVPPAHVLPETWTPGGTFAATTLDIAGYIAAHGERMPAAGVAPSSFAVATVVLSWGRLLSPSEMAFYDANARRAAATTELPFSIGFGQGLTLPFFLATGGRATLRTRIDPAAP